LDFKPTIDNFNSIASNIKIAWRRQHRSPYLHGLAKTGAGKSMRKFTWNCSSSPGKPAAAISRETSLWHCSQAGSARLPEHQFFPSDQPQQYASSFRLAFSEWHYGKTRSGVGAGKKGKGVSRFRSVAISETKFKSFRRYPAIKPVYYVPFEETLRNILPNEFHAEGGKNSHQLQPVNDQSP